MQGLERILTDVKARPAHDEAELYLRGAGTLIVPLTEHLFISRHFSKRQTLEGIVHELREIPAQSIRVRKKSEGHPFNIIQVVGPPSLGKSLRERFGGHFTTKDYTATARKTYGNPGMVLAISEDLQGVMMAVKEHNESLKRFKETLGRRFEGRSKAYVTRIHRALGQQARNGEEIERKYRDIVPEKLLEERAAIQSLYEKAAATEGITLREDKDGLIEPLLVDTRHLYGKRSMNHQELSDETWAHLDIEIPGWNTDKPEISWVVIHYERDGKTYLREMHTASSIGTKEYNGHKVICYHGDIARLLIGVKESIREQNPLVLTAHNGRFDYIKMREAPELKGLKDRFTPDEQDEHEPAHEATTRFFERIGVKSRLFLDFLWFARLQYDWAPNKKLNLVGKLALGERAFDKELTYIMMEGLEATARRYDRIKGMKGIEDILMAKGKTLEDVRLASEEAALKIASYAGNDVEVLHDMRASEVYANYLWRTSMVAEHYGLVLEHLAYSPRTLLRINERSFTHSTGADHDKLFMSRRGAREEYSKDKQRFRKLLERMGGARAQPGLYKGVHLVHLRYGNALRHILARSVPESRWLFKQEARSKEDRHLLARYGNTLAEWLIADYAKLDRLKRRVEATKKRMRNNDPFFDEDYPSIGALLQAQNKTIKDHVFYGSLTSEELHKGAGWILEAGHIEHGWSWQDMLSLINDQARLARAQYKFEQQFHTTHDEVTGVLERLVGGAKSLAEEHGLEVIHHEGPYLYLHGDSSSFIRKHGEEHLIHTFKEALITTDAKPLVTDGLGRGKQRLYSSVHGYFKGIKVVDHPTHLLSVSEMRGFVGFYGHLAKGEYRESLESLLREHRSLSAGDIVAEDVVRHSKSTDRYAAFEDGEKILFRTKPPEGIHYDLRKGHVSEKEDAVEVLFDDERARHYVTESVLGEERKVYLMSLRDLRPDREMYTRRSERRIRKLLLGLVGEEALASLLEEGSIEEAARKLEERVHTW